MNGVIIYELRSSLNTEMSRTQLATIFEASDKVCHTGFTQKKTNMKFEKVFVAVAKRLI